MHIAMWLGDLNISPEMSNNAKNDFLVFAIFCHFLPVKTG